MLIFFSLYCCDGWDYIKSFTHVLTVYQIHQTWIHLLNQLFHPSSHTSWSSFNRYHLCIYLHVYTFYCIQLKYRMRIIMFWKFMKSTVNNFDPLKNRSTYFFRYTMFCKGCSSCSSICPPYQNPTLGTLTTVLQQQWPVVPYYLCHNRSIVLICIMANQR
jgi:hypothetical protein